MGSLIKAVGVAGDIVDGAFVVAVGTVGWRKWWIPSLLLVY
jgi:hypothetical protein